MARAWLVEVILRLRRQHEVDLQVYQMAHQNTLDKILHYVLVPIETAAFLITLAAVVRLLGPKENWALQDLTPLATAWTMGLLSLILSPTWIGLAACLFQVAVVSNIWYPEIVSRPYLALALSLTAWAVAFIIQVGVGHWILESNHPTFLDNLPEVSWLAMAQSVLIAWKS